MKEVKMREIKREEAESLGIDSQWIERTKMKLNN